uniref:Uncharacterized protein n=1 Tax=Pseudo-nitzschia australis TaxID=44445 RepID=A0A7S4EQY1_9STRA|mmetsp:Transcript_278/g.704  ORF Transcript_278/g.704 Transcript_278/m.704 type:complete len:398 (+) Transcript_278:131-1324(+)
MIGKYHSFEGTQKPLLLNRIIGFSDWWTLQESSSSESSVTHVLDLRSPDEQQKRCLCPSLRKESRSLVVVPIPVSVVEQRSFELPARHVKFSILVTESDLLRVGSFLCGSNRKRPNPWKITHVLLDNEEFWSKAHDMGMVNQKYTEAQLQTELQGHKRQRLDQEYPIWHGIKDPTLQNPRQFSKFPLARLWQPDPMIANILFPLMVKAYDNNQRSLSGEALLEVWDLAAGAGRDVAFLAEELFAVNKTHQVIAVDHRYNDKETKIVNDFWDRRGIGKQTTSLKLNLSHWKTLEQAMASAFTQKQVAAMFCVRFWKQDLVEAIANSASIFPGVLFALSHFCKPSLGATWDFDHPSKKTVLERNQLHDIFHAKWDILHDEISLDSDHGRTMIHFVARRR